MSDQQRKIDLIEMCKVRIDDCARQFAGLRSVEWGVAFQAYAGYAALGVAYHSVAARYPHWSITLITVAAIFGLFVCTFYLSCRIQERLHSTRNRQNKYLKLLETLLIGPESDSAPLNIGQTASDLQSLAIDPSPSVSTINWRVLEWRPLQWIERLWEGLTTYSAPIHPYWYGFGTQTIVGLLWVGVLTAYILAAAATSAPREDSGPVSLSEVTHRVEVHLDDLERLKSVVDRLNLTPSKGTNSSGDK